MASQQKIHSTIDHASITPLSHFLQEALQMPFESDLVSRVNLDLSVVDRCRHAVARYDNQFIPWRLEAYENRSNPRISDESVGIYPEQRPGELWPGLFNQRTMIREGKVGYDFFLNDDYLARDVKRTLLFSHGVYIDSPNFMELGHVVTEAICLEDTKRQLSQYSELCALIDKKIVIPVPIGLIDYVDFDQPWLFAGSNFEVDAGTRENLEDIKRLMLRKRAKLKKSQAEMAVIQAMMSRHYARQKGDFFQPLLQNDAEALAFSEILHQIDNKIARKTKLQPLQSYYLSSNFGIDSSKVSTKDISSIRENEEIFGMWRGMVGGALLHLAEHTDDYGDSQAELSNYIKQHEAEWRSKALGVTGRGILGTIVDAKSDVATGLIAGAIGANYDPVTTLLAGGIAGSIQPLLKIFGKADKSHSGRAIRIALNSHFLAVGAKFK